MTEEKIIEYIKKELPETEMKEVGQWITLSEENENFFQKVKFVWECSAQENQTVSINKSMAWDKIQNAISEEKEVGSTKHTLYILRRIAAVVLLLISLGIIVQVFRNQNRNIEINWLSETTTTGIKEVILPDNSSIWLNSNSTLTYPENFDRRTRSVKLSGEAYFEVEKNKRKPFVITTQFAGIEVLGTSFNVNSDLLNSQVIVSVASGEVALYDTIDTNNRKILGHGDQGLITVDHKTIIKKENEDVNFLAWKTGILNFKNTPIEIVCEDLSDYFDTTIDFTRTMAMMEKRLTATYENKDLDEILKILELTLDVKHQSSGDSIILLNE